MEEEKVVTTDGGASRSVVASAAAPSPLVSEAVREDDTAAQLTARIDALQRSRPQSTTRFNLTTELFTFLKDKNVRRGELVCKYGGELLQYHASKLGDDVWSMYEKVFLAATEAHETDIRDTCFTALGKQFPLSMRVRRLLGIRFEADGRWDDARRLYDKILTEEPANAGIWKRKICVLRSQHDTTAAIDELVKYTEAFSSDHMAWEELAQLYISQERFELAKFCLEELIVLVPENYLYHLQMADLVYTIGGKGCTEQARPYYAQSLELKPNNNLRALYGLALCLRGAGAGGKQGHAAELQLWTAHKLLSHYRTLQPKAIPLVEAVFTS
jgi:tetratricopeptide (TPR) repeat protein